ncbi:MAG: D-alanyl-D-alanine carboxypeptidase [Thermodesulfobacteriota bacterium]|nr:D-alanyl-D-alanine carboxypeptidase [Thermodesulfobacteriota bacterium]
MMQKLITPRAFASQHKTVVYGRAFKALLKSSFRRTTQTVLSAVLFCIVGAAASAASLPDQPLPDKAAGLIKNGGFIVTKGGRVIAANNPDSLLAPASIIKIATACAALEILGPDFRFETQFYHNRENDLYIRGFGDPALTSEEISKIIDVLKEKNVHQIRNILLDDYLFDIAVDPDGSGLRLNPYDAVNSALAVNFNTIHIMVSQEGAVRSAEPQTPTLPLMKKLGKGLKPGVYRLNISTDRKNITRHTGELFQAIQKKKKIPGNGRIIHSHVPDDLTPVYIHRSSKKLDSLIESLMLYSNNYTANQLFLTCGAKQSGYPATWAKGRNALAEYLDKELGIDEKSVKIDEGSGLSRKNRVTPRAMIKILEAFRPYYMLLPLADNRRVKSGTLTGVFSYAGYFLTDKQPDSFVLILNQDKNQRDRLLDILENIHSLPLK